MILAGWVGLLASVPFVPPVDAGMRPYAVTLPLVAFLLAEGFSWLSFWPAKREAAPEPAMPEASFNWPVGLSIFLAVLVVCGPPLVKASAVPLNAPAPLACPAGEVYLWLQPVKDARIDLVDALPSQHPLRPAIAVADYLDNIQRIKRATPELAQSLAGLTAGQSIQFSINLAGLEQDVLPVFLIAPRASLGDGAQPLQVCAHLLGEESDGHFYQADQLLLEAK